MKNIEKSNILQDYQIESWFETFFLKIKQIILKHKIFTRIQIYNLLVLSIKQHEI